MNQKISVHNRRQGGAAALQVMEAYVPAGVLLLGALLDLKGDRARAEERAARAGQVGERGRGAHGQALRAQRGMAEASVHLCFRGMLSTVSSGASLLSIGHLKPMKMSVAKGNFCGRCSRRPPHSLHAVL